MLLPHVETLPSCVGGKLLYVRLELCQDEALKGGVLTEKA